MPAKNSQNRVQTTDAGLEIPIPKKRDVFGDLAKTAQPAKPQKARRDRTRLSGKARPSNKPL